MMKEKQLLFFKWNERTSSPMDISGKPCVNHTYESFYIGLGFIGFYWDSMYYDGLPCWSLGTGLFRFSYFYGHRWEKLEQ